MNTIRAIEMKVCRLSGTLSQSRLVSWQSAGGGAHWKKSTTYTNCGGVRQGIVPHDNGTVTSCVSRWKFLSKQSDSLWRTPFRARCKVSCGITAGKRLSDRMVANSKNH